MTTKSVEQDTKVAENGKNVPETEGKETSADVAEQEGQTSDAKASASKDSTPKFTFANDEELENSPHVLRVAQRMKDKEIDPVRHELREAKEENERIKQDKDFGQLGSLLKRVGDEEGDSHDFKILDEAYKVFGEYRKRLLDDSKNLSTEKETVKTAKSEQRQQKAFGLYLKYVVEDGAKLYAESKSFVDSLLSEAKTDTELELMARIKAIELKAGVKPAKSHKPETNRSNAPGGKSLDTPQAQVKAGLDKLRRE